MGGEDGGDTDDSEDFTVTCGTILCRLRERGRDSVDIATASRALLAAEEEEDTCLVIDGIFRCAKVVVDMDAEGDSKLLVVFEDEVVTAAGIREAEAENARRTVLHNW